MKLEDYIIENELGIGAPFSNALEDFIPKADLHVIGNCGECKHWDEEYIQMQTEPVKMCRQPTRGTRSHVMAPPKDFGCIHWEKK